MLKHGKVTKAPFQNFKHIIVLRTSKQRFLTSTDIYGQRHGKKQIPKDPTIYVNADGVADIVG